MSRLTAKRRIIVLAPIVLFILGCAALAISRPHMVRLYFVGRSELDEIAPGVWVDPDMPELKRQELLASIDEAKGRISALYGDYTASPVIVAGHTSKVWRRYAGGGVSSIGISFIVPGRTFIVLGANGLSVDPIAHEMAHAEFAYRVGYWNRKKVPNWFDEGLAVSFDDRYTEDEWVRLTNGGELGTTVDQLDTITARNRLGYLIAQHEVTRWLEGIGQDGFLTFLTDVRSGVDFQEAYRLAEQAQN